MKTLRYIIFLIFATLNVLTAVGRDPERKLFGRQKAKEEVKANEHTKFRVEKKVGLTKQEPELYRSFRKINGWFVGEDKLTKEKARHLSVYYRLSKKNSAGNWTRMEALDNLGNLTTRHRLRPYAIRDYDMEIDTLANREWLEKVKQMCQWDFVYDNDGKNVLQERAFDAEGNIIYAFTPVPVNDSVVIGTYIDNNGRPSNLRGTDGSSLVRITRNSKGQEIRVELINERGESIPNHAGVEMECYEYDDLGRLSSQYSCNSKGERVNDIYGNCSQNFSYKGNTSLIETILSLNKDGKPKRTLGSEGAEYKKREYDNYDRLIKESTFLGDGRTKDDCNNGYHIVTLDYDSHGNRIWTKFYDKDNHLVTSNYGYAIAHMEFDNKNRETKWEIFDKDSVYINDKNGQCKSEGRYIDETKQVEYKIYSWRNNELVVIESQEVHGDTTIVRKEKPESFSEKQAYYWYYKESAKNYRKYIYYNDVVKIDSLDEYGDEFYSVYYNKDNSPIIGNFGFHIWRNHIEREFDDNGTIIKKREYKEWFDEKNNKIPGDEEYITDYKERSIIGKKILNEQVVSSYKNYYQDDNLKIIKSFIPYSMLGKRARMPMNGAGSGYYAISRKTNTGENYSTVAYRNEFGEPAYATFDNQYAFSYYVNDKYNRRIIYSEDNENINYNEYVYYQNLPKASYVMVIDTVGFDNGFLDGDIILQYGDKWHYALEDTVMRHKNLLDLDFQYIMLADTSKTVRVLRHHPETMSSEIVTLRLPKGRLSDFGITTDCMAYTRKELKRLQDLLQDSVSSHNWKWEYNTIRSSENGYSHPVSIDVPSKIYNAQGFFHLGFRDPSIDLVVNKYKKEKPDSITAEMQWIPLYYEPMQRNNIYIYNESENGYIKTLYHSDNGKDIKKLTFSGRLYSNGWYLYLNNEEYDRIWNMLKAYDDTAHIILRQYIPEKLVTENGKKKIPVLKAMKRIGKVIKSEHEDGTTYYMVRVPYDDARLAERYRNITQRIDLDGFTAMQNKTNEECWVKKNEDGTYNYFLYKGNKILYMENLTEEEIHSHI